LFFELSRIQEGAMKKCFRATLLLFLSLLAISMQGQSLKTSAMPLDEFFDYVNIQSVHLSPNGDSILITTRRPDWEHNRYRSDIWISRKGATPVQLTHSGSDNDPEWSPDGQWIAFTSSGELPGEVQGHDGPTELYVISARGGDPIPFTRGEESVHAYAWGTDSRSIYFAAREAWNKATKDAYAEHWKDVVEYRGSDRGDVICRASMAEAIRRTETMPSALSTKENSATAPLRPETDGIALAHTPLVVRDIAVSHDGHTLAFNTSPASHRHENIKDYEIFLLDANGGTSRQLTHNETSESSLIWGPDDKRLFFTTYGSATGNGEHVQERVYSVDAGSGAIERWGSKFAGALGGTYATAPNGSLLTTGTIGTETTVYIQNSPNADVKPFPGPAGSYISISFAADSPKIAFVHCAWGEPAEVYLAEDIEHLQQAKPITHFNDNFRKYELPKGRPYRWKADDGMEIEGVLLYPPGKYGAKNLPTLTLIHGGPANTDGDRFRADWYDWAVLAAMRGYLVFRPNYRGSAAYGDAFLQRIAPRIVSLPGRDILAGVNALVKEGIADPHKLSIGGYSYGGFLTNWLITQTAIFKAALSGAGAVEHVMQWGNDDLPLDDIESLGGYPWQVPQNYNHEAAIFQMDKVRTPTHIVGATLDIRVYVGEQFLLERSLYSLGIPHKLLLFPEEGHLLSDNPWHGKIKVREELLWLEKYCPSDKNLEAADPNSSNNDLRFQHAQTTRRSSLIGK
jgi:dipeptidyl aminopeptidase/acylaminoacyl peptidase